MFFLHNFKSLIYAELGDQHMERVKNLLANQCCDLKPTEMGKWKSLLTSLALRSGLWFIISKKFLKLVFKCSFKRRLSFNAL